MYHGKLYQSRQDEVDIVCKFILNKDHVGFRKYVSDRYQLEECQGILQKMLSVKQQVHLSNRLIQDNLDIVRHYHKQSFEPKYNRLVPSRMYVLCIFRLGVIVNLLLFQRFEHEQLPYEPYNEKLEKLLNMKFNWNK